MPDSSGAGRDGDPHGGAAEALERGLRTASVLQDSPLPPALPAFLEACARLAGEAIRWGDFAAARRLVDQAERAVAVGEVAA